jgi:hypothetical protein
MSDDCKFRIPESCREFGKGNLDERLEVARSFIKTFVEKVAPLKSVDDSDKAWTQAIRRRFIEICPEGCYALPSDPLRSKGEYLVDYTWSEEKNGKRVLLAGESEWGSGRYGRIHWTPVEDDFEKILAIKAPFKVLIFSSICKPYGTMQETDFSFDYAKDRIKPSLENYGHHIPGEVYIFIDFPQTGIPGGNGIFRSFIWSATKFGKDEVKLEDGPGGDLIRPTEFEADWKLHKEVRG